MPRITVQELIINKRFRPHLILGCLNLNLANKVVSKNNIP